MQVKAVKTSSGARALLFSYGILFEIFFIGLCLFMPECWLATEIRNFGIIIHYPFLMLLENARNDANAIVVMIIGISLMALFLGFFVFQTAYLGELG